MNTKQLFHMEQKLVILCAVSAILAGGAEPLYGENTSANHSPALPCSTTQQSDIPLAPIVLASDSQELSTCINLGIQDLLMGYSTRARAYIYKAIELDKESLLAHCSLLLFEESSPTAKSALLRRIEHLINCDDIALTPPELFYVEKFLQISEGDIAGAAEEFRKRSQWYRADILSGCWAALLYHYSGNGFTGDGHPTDYQSKAREHVETLLKSHPSHPLVHYIKAAIEENAETVSDDVLHSAEMAAKSIDSSIAHQLLGHLLFKRKDYKKAADSFLHATTRTEEDCIVHNMKPSDSFEYVCSKLSWLTSSLLAGSSWESIVQEIFNDKDFIHVKQLDSRGAILYRWEYQTFILRSLLNRPDVPTLKEIEQAKQFAFLSRGELDDDAVNDFCEILLSALQVRLLIKDNRPYAAERALQKAQAAYQRLIVPRETYHQQSITYKLCFKRAIDCADVAINISKMNLYKNTSDIWKERIQEIKLGQPHLLPPIVPIYPTRDE